MTQRSALVLLLFAVAVLAVAFVPRGLQRYREGKEEQRLREEERRNQVEYEGPDVEVMGGPQAPLKAIWAVPSRRFTKEGVQDVNEVKQWVREHPKLVNLTVVRMGTPQGNPVLQANNITCAGLSVGGEYLFRLWDRPVRRWRHVSLQKAPGVSYRAHDVLEVFEQYLENTGHLPRDRTLGQPGTRTRAP